MTSKRSVFGKIGLVLLAMFVLFNVWLFAMGKSYVYKALLYNFADIDDYKIFPNRVIHKSDKPQEWPVSKELNKKPLPASLISTLDSLESVAFLIIKNDTIVHEQYWDGYGPMSFSNSFSMAKTYVGVLTGIALEEGKIKSLDQSVGDFLPYFKEDGKDKITIRHLLTMSAGLDWVESYASPFSITTEAYYGDDLEKVIKTLNVESTPGQKFMYKSGDTQILGLVLEKATGMPLGEYAEKKLWKPLGSVNDALWSLDKEGGHEKAYCCLNTDARDFARLGKLFLHKGMWDSTRIISEEYIQLTTQANMLPNGESDSKGEKVDFYGYLWWTIPDYKGHKIYYARGILGQYMIMIPDKNVIVVRLGNKRGAHDGEHYREVYQMIDAAMEF